MINSQSFGQTINAINGGIECGQAPGSAGYEEMENRVQLYQQFSTLLGVPAVSNVGC